MSSTLGVAHLPYTSMAVSIVLAVLRGTLEVARTVVSGLLAVAVVVDVNLVGATTYECQRQRNRGQTCQQDRPPLATPRVTTLRVAFHVPPGTLKCRPVLVREPSGRSLLPPPPRAALVR